MQLPSVDRQTGSRPAGADLVSSNGQKVLPLPPVNPSTSPLSEGVVNKIGTSAKTGAIYNTVSDPAVKGSEAGTGSKDWTIKRPAAEPVKEPPPEPISKMLLEFLRAMWRASGSAIEIAQAQNRNLQVNQNNPNATPGVLAKQDLTYSPSKIRKNDKI